MRNSVAIKPLLKFSRESESIQCSEPRPLTVKHQFAMQSAGIRFVEWRVHVPRRIPATSVN